MKKELTPEEKFLQSKGLDVVFTEVYQYEKGKETIPINLKQFLKEYAAKAVEKSEQLILWLENECPHGTMTNDLSHDFAAILRRKLDNIKQSS